MRKQLRFFSIISSSRRWSRCCRRLVEKTLERGWRAVVQAGSDERLAAIDLALWTYKEDSFLAHGTPRTATRPSSLST